MIDTKAIRTKILDLAFQGKLTDQRAEEGTGETLYVDIQAGKKKQVQWPDVDLKKIPSHIPDSWKWVWFLSVVDIAANLVPPEGYQDLLHIAPDNIEKGTGKLLPCRTVGEDRVTSANHLFERGQIIYSKIRPRLRKVVVAPFDGLCSADMYPLKTQLDTQYVFYYILSESFNQQVNEATSNRVLLPKINKKELQKIYIPLPPLGEQNRIARIVTDVFAQLDLIDDLQMQYANDMDTLKTKLFEAALRGKLTEQLLEDGTAEELYQQIQAEKQELVKAKKIKKEQPLPPIETKDIPFPLPTNWKWVRLGDIARKIASGNTPTGGRNSDVYVHSGYCLFREQNIYNDGIHEEGMVYITEELIATRENSTVYAGDILLNITGGSIGRCAVVPDSFDRGSVNQHILIIRMIDERLRHYIHKVICSPYAQKYINQKAFGDKGGFSGTRCKMMPIPLPPLEEQKRIVERIDSIYASI